MKKDLQIGVIALFHVFSDHLTDLLIKVGMYTRLDFSSV